MILRKPYAFLIKHFKLIHLFITILIINLINKTNDIVDFFKDYINDDVFEVNVSEYVNIFTYISIFIIIGLALIIIILMRKKDKPLLFYILTFISYSVLFVGFIYISSVISELEFNLLDRKSIGFVRDITRILLIGQWLFLIPYIIRTLGFDIKKFDFKKDLQELEITEEDSEEFELVSPLDMNKVGKVTRKKVRELKYYYIENKLFIIISLVGIVLLSGFYIIKKIDFESLKKYDEKEIIKMDNFYTMTIDDSYITTKNDDGKVIAVNNNFFLIVKFTVNSNYNGQFALDTSKFIVKIKDKEFMASRNYYNYFKNYGIGYKSQRFSLSDNKTYILVYNIPDKYKKANITLEYNYKYDYSEEEAKMIKKVVKLKPEKKK